MQVYTMLCTVLLQILEVNNLGSFGYLLKVDILSYINKLTVIISVLIFTLDDTDYKNKFIVHL